MFQFISVTDLIRVITNPKNNVSFLYPIKDIQGVEHSTLIFWDESCEIQSGRRNRGSGFLERDE